MGNGVTECGWRPTPEARGGFWEILKKSVSRVETKHRTRRVDFRLLAEVLGRCRTRWGGRWKSQNRKIVPLSPYVEKPLNSKVIKSFVLELRNRYVFFEFRDSYVLCIYIYEHYMSISQSRIWLWYTGSNGNEGVPYTSQISKPWWQGAGNI